MLHALKNAEKKRREFRDQLKSGHLLRFPGAFSPLVAMLIEQIGFEGVYVSGAAVANDLGLPDIGLTTLSEVAARGQVIARATNLPSLIDCDTGFGEPANVARTILSIESAGLSGCHLEDQENPKRCGHLDDKTLVERNTMVKKLKAAVEAKQDQNFLIMARTDARAIEGLDGAVNRAKAYVQAGAEMIFPEALNDLSEFEAFRRAVDVPLLANMTEFGKSPLLSTKQLEDAGFNMVIYPVTCLRLAMKAVEDGLNSIKNTGNQESLVENMQTRKRLYEILQYEAYNQFDRDIFNFEV
jgi:methylisocitrate lyase